MRFQAISCTYLLVLALWIHPVFVSDLSAQRSTIAQTEEQLKELYGLDKLKALNRLTEYYLNTDIRKAQRYGRQAVSLAENIFVPTNTLVHQSERPQQVQAYFQLGKVLFYRESYLESLVNLESAQELALEIGYTTYLEETQQYMDRIGMLVVSGAVKENFLNKTLGDLKVGEALSDAAKAITVETEIGFAIRNEKNGELRSAVEHYDKAIKLLRDLGEAERIIELQIKVAGLLDELDQHVEAQKFLSDALVEAEFAPTPKNPPLRGDTLSMKSPGSGASGQRDGKSLSPEQQNLIDLANTAAREKDYEKSVAYYKLYQELSQKVQEDSVTSAVERKKRDNEIMLLRQQKQIADLNVVMAERENERQIRLRNTSVLVALLILASSLVTLYFYIAKRREHKKLAIAYRDLDKTKVKLVGAEKRIVNLLSQHVSSDIAKELLMNFADKPGERLFVCIMFLDIRDFTAMAEQLSPEEIIEYQNKVFGFMIDIVQQHNGNINQLLGDGFMATFGAPVSRGNDCQNAFYAAQEILREMKERGEAGLMQKTKVGIGLHAGYVVTGNVGNESRKQYSVTGNPVIIASRVEQLNKEYKTQLIITEEVYEKLEKPLKLAQPFLEVEVKGRSHPVRILKIA